MKARVTLTAVAVALGVVVPTLPDPAAGGPAEVRADLAAMYGAMGDVVVAARDLGAPASVASLPLSQDEFEAAVADLSDEEAAILGAHLTAAPEWDGAVEGYARAARELTSSSFEPSRPVEPTEPRNCPAEPPGPDVGNVSIFVAESVASVLTAVAAPLPSAQIIFQLSLPNIYKIVAVAVRVAAQITARTLTYVRDIYWDCGTLELFDVAGSMENSAVQIYGLAREANDAVNRVNEGLRTISDHIGQLQGAQNDLERMRIQHALAAPVGTVVNVAYVLPASEGGFLDATPVGVQSIVADTLQAAREAPIPVNAAAIAFQAQAGSALTAGDYLTAYRLFQRSYQAIGR